MGAPAIREGSEERVDGGPGQREATHDVRRRQDRLVEEELEDVERTARGGNGPAHGSCSLWGGSSVGL